MVGGVTLDESLPDTPFLNSLRKSVTCHSLTLGVGLSDIPWMEIHSNLPLGGGQLETLPSSEPTVEMTSEHSLGLDFPGLFFWYRVSLFYFTGSSVLTIRCLGPNFGSRPIETCYTQNTSCSVSSFPDRVRRTLSSTPGPSGPQRSVVSSLVLRGWVSKDLWDTGASASVVFVTLQPAPSGRTLFGSVETPGRSIRKHTPSPKVFTRSEPLGPSRPLESKNFLP